MREVVKMMLCLLASIGWPIAIQRWAPETLTWLLGLVPSLLLGFAGQFRQVDDLETPPASSRLCYPIS
jgi:hypothetical protein